MTNSPSSLVKKTVNSLLDFLSKEGNVPMIMPTELTLTNLLNVSRSILAQAYSDLENKGIIRQEMRSRLVLRLPQAEDYYLNIDKINSKTQLVENFILEKFSKNELQSGDKLSELQIAKESGANTVTVREVLLKISNTGIIRKDPRKKWEVIDLSEKKMNEITDYRSIMELFGLNCLFDNGPLPASALQKFKKLLNRHQSVLAKSTIDRDEVIELENDFHKSFIKYTNNQVIQESYESIFFVTRFHLRQRIMTQDRFRYLIEEHIRVLLALLENNYEGAVAELKNHFRESKAFFHNASLSQMAPEK
ncbi:GntR family transcriptional regulator [Arundinibacter roseus]|uniref:FCD domain-containing protein n=1 Tax=Arundinibacter roseus TaxID=2070510 RepID=A0A4R4K968_9BACT|nr:GntR family transcriptional regulator [Arundinibacter roseus]TDB62729.1 FCD domain-containing protein [Arundinibacter roseus]